ncbi:hypothetical protein Lal_00016021 [Lupinus albus]|nr:hypothetical protein Lal_00016021 [Lupinus albus]
MAFSCADESLVDNNFNKRGTEPASTKQDLLKMLVLERSLISNAARLHIPTDIASLTAKISSRNAIGIAILLNQPPQHQVRYQFNASKPLTCLRTY